MKAWWILAIFVVLGTVLASTLVSMGLTASLEDEKVPCYDRWNNEIKGATCIDKANFDSSSEALSFSVIGSLTMFALTTVSGYILARMAEDVL